MMFLYVIVDSVSGEARVFLDRNDDSAKRGFANSLKGHPFASDMNLFSYGELPVEKSEDGKYDLTEPLMYEGYLVCKGSDIVDKVEDAV